MLVSGRLLTLQGINISHLGKRKIIFKMPFFGDMLVSWRVLIGSYWPKMCMLPILLCPPPKMSSRCQDERHPFEGIGALSAGASSRLLQDGNLVASM